jgi:hypothetical protein
MKLFLNGAAAALLALGVGTGAQANTLTVLTGFGDADFTSGSPSLEDQEVAVGEIRIGNNGLSGDRELGINTPPPAANVASGQFSFTSGTAYDFDFGYVAATNTLTLSLGGTSIFTDVFTNVGDANIMYIRAASRDETGDVESTLLSDIMFNGGGVLGSVLSEDGARTYATITGADFASDWNLTGDLTFTGPFGKTGSNYAVQFKLVETTPIPLPAAGWMLIAGVGGLVALKRRRKAA